MTTWTAIVPGRTWLRRGEAKLMWAGCVICGAGWLYSAVDANWCGEVFTVSQLVAAWLVALPAIREAAWPLPDELDEVHSHRLVSLAVLGSIWSGEYAAALVTPLVMRLGHWLESRGVPGKNDARASLRRLVAGPVYVVDEADRSVRRAASAERGQLLSVRPGERFTVDGIVEWGESTADEALLNGESLPRELHPGTHVLAGTANGSGALFVRVTATSEQTQVGQMARDFDVTLARQPRATRWLEKFTRVYAPAVGLFAAVVWAGTGNASRASALLVSCCPCALALAGPAAMVAAISAAWRRDIVFRPDGRWESLADVRSMALDKTGTITHGRLAITRWRSWDRRQSDGEVLSIARRIARCSTHPVAVAIVEGIPMGGEVRDSRTLARVCELPGHGVSAIDGDHTIRLGKLGWLESEGVECPADVLDDVAAHTGPAVFLAIDRQCLAYFLLADAVRESSRPSMERLRTLGVSRLVMLTGDRAVAAHSAASTLDFDEIRAECSPLDKCEAMRREVAYRGRAAMVGDGANDALAMAASDVGVAIDRADVPVAQGAADVILMRGGLEGLPVAIELARRSRRLLAVNLALAAGSTVLLAALAASGVLRTAPAAVAHNVGAVLVLVHSGWFVVRESRRRERRANDPKA